MTRNHLLLFAVATGSGLAVALGGFGLAWSAALVLLGVAALVALGRAGGGRAAGLIVAALLLSSLALLLGDGRGRPESEPAGCDPSCGTALGDVVAVGALIVIGVCVLLWAVLRRFEARK
ncbi:hypothetical protein OJ997_30490 [Solirubrobacter phytolaccae]|uniref:Uncharacterized protein n=1 Tax=Solirubrobacter phytolaccae TaxID=1404360 RepID=A0A9X3SE95_9ACTN|nr:hypothetical protein [Solirubrobacter phytolaccae]MDA0184670.1 hypothetical protein [Solirubrobacter phytolaccae]